MSFKLKITNTYMDYHFARRQHILEYWHADYIVSKLAIPKLNHLLRMNHEDIIQT